MSKVHASHIAAASVGIGGGVKDQYADIVNHSRDAENERIADLVERHMVMGEEKAGLPVNSMNPIERDEAILAQAIAREIKGEKHEDKQVNPLGALAVGALSPVGGMKSAVENNVEIAATERAERVVEKMRTENYKHYNMNQEYESGLAESLKGKLADRGIAVEGKWANRVQEEQTARSAEMNIRQ